MLASQQRLKPLKLSPPVARVGLRAGTRRGPLTVRAGFGYGSARRALALSSGGGDSGYSIGSNIAGESYVERAIERGLSYANRAKTLAPAGTPVAEMADAIIAELEEARSLRQTLLEGEQVVTPERCACLSQGGEKDRAPGSTLRYSSVSACLFRAGAC